MCIDMEEESEAVSLHSQDEMRSGSQVDYHGSPDGGAKNKRKTTVGDQASQENKKDKKSTTCNTSKPKKSEKTKQTNNEDSEAAKTSIENKQKEQITQDKEENNNTDKNIEKSSKDNYGSKKDTGIPRIEKLAQPKRNHPEFVKSRECISWPEHPIGSSSDVPPPRLQELSAPKKIHPEYQPERESIYWPDRKSGTLTAEASERVKQLAEPRVKSDNTRDPEWPVTQAAKEATASERIHLLACPKEAHKDYKYPRPAESYIPETVILVKPSERVVKLAKPKRLNTLEEEFKWGQVDPSALRAVPTQRVEQLSQPKIGHPAYTGPRSPIWTPSTEAMKGSSTLRIQQLAKPKKRFTQNDVKEKLPADWLHHIAPLKLVSKAPPPSLRARKQWHQNDFS